MLSLWVLFSAAVALSIATTVDDCPASLLRDGSLQASNGFCFYFSMKDIGEYKAAESHCEKYGGTLALVKTQEIQDYLNNHLKYTYGHNKGIVYIGLNDIGEEGKYMWEDGTPLGKWQNWAPGYGPENELFSSKSSWLRDCVALDSSRDGRWIDHHCTAGWLLGQKNPFICQFKATPKPTSHKPTTPKPTTPKPRTPKPTLPKSTTPKPTTIKPSTPKATTHKTTISRPTTPKPTTIKPTTHEPSTHKPITPKPTTSILKTLKPTTDATITLKPITAKPSSSKPTTQVPKTPRPTCPPFSCSLDCGFEGYKTDTKGCAVCVCDL